MSTDTLADWMGRPAFDGLGESPRNVDFYDLHPGYVYDPDDRIVPGPRPPRAMPHWAAPEILDPFELP